jgi:hypothetical protein
MVRAQFDLAVWYSYGEKRTTAPTHTTTITGGAMGGRGHVQGPKGDTYAVYITKAPAK